MSPGPSLCGDIEVHAARHVIHQLLPHGFARRAFRVPFAGRHDYEGSPPTNMLWSLLFGEAQDFGQTRLGLCDSPDSAGFGTWRVHGSFKTRMVVLNQTTLEHRTELTPWSAARPSLGGGLLCQAGASFPALGRLPSPATAATRPKRMKPQAATLRATRKSPVVSARRPVPFISRKETALLTR